MRPPLLRAPRRLPPFLARASTLALATAVMFGGGAAMLATGLLTWHPEQNPRWLLATLTVLSAGFAVGALALGPRFDRRGALLMLGVQVATIAALSHTTGDDVAALANGAVLPVVAAYATWFLHPVWGRIVVYTGALGWAVAVGTREEISAQGFAAQILLQAVLAAEAFAWIKRTMERLARTDHLTGLLNRHGIVEYAERVLESTTRPGETAAIVMIDLDDLRAVNNRDGHQAGDDLIRAAARVWSAHLLPRQRAGRLGGDEFILVLPRTGQAEAEELMRRMAEDVPVSPVSWSAGVATGRAGDPLLRVLEAADQLMYRSKRGRRPDPVDDPTTTPARPRPLTPPTDPRPVP